MVCLGFEGVSDTSISISIYSNKSNIKFVIQNFLQNIIACLILKKYQRITLTLLQSFWTKSSLSSFLISVTCFIILSEGNTTYRKCYKGSAFLRNSSKCSKCYSPGLRVMPWANRPMHLRYELFVELCYWLLTEQTTKLFSSFSKSWHL